MKKYRITYYYLQKIKYSLLKALLFCGIIDEIKKLEITFYELTLVALFYELFPAKLG